MLVVGRGLSAYLAADCAVSDHGLMPSLVAEFRFSVQCWGEAILEWRSAMLDRFQAWCLTILVVVLLEPVSWITSQVPPCIVDPSRYDKYYSYEHQCPTFSIFILDIFGLVVEKMGDPNWVTAIATATIAGFTIVLSIATYNQAKLTRGLLSLSRDEFNSTHRPRIILREAFTGSVLEGEPVSVFYTIANIGETRGTIIKSWINVEIIAQGASRLLVAPTLIMQNEIGPFGLAPGEAMTVKYPKPTFDWKAEMFKIKAFPVASQIGTGVIERRDATAHLSGQIIYLDEAGTARRTAFRREWIPERQRFYRILDEPDLDYSD
jgi:hypothetical protein